MTIIHKRQDRLCICAHPALNTANHDIPKSFGNHTKRMIQPKVVIYPKYSAYTPYSAKYLKYAQIRDSPVQ